MEQLEDEYAYYIFAPNTPNPIDIVATQMRWLCCPQDLPYVPHHSESTIRALDRLDGALRVLAQRLDRLNWPLRGGVRNYLALFEATLNTFKHLENGQCIPFLRRLSHRSVHLFIRSFIHSSEAQANARALTDVGMHRIDRPSTSQPPAPPPPAPPRARPADDDDDSSEDSSAPPDKEAHEHPAGRMTRSASLRARGGRASTSSSRAPSNSPRRKSSSRAPSASSAPSGSGNPAAAPKPGKGGKKSGEPAKSSNRGKASKKKMPNLRNELV